MTFRLKPLRLSLNCTHGQVPALCHPLKESIAMLIIEKVLILRTTSIFEAVREEFLAEVAQRSVPVMLDTGQVLFEQGEMGTSLFVVVSGRLEVVINGVAVSQMGEREVIGEMAALDPEPRSATLKATEPSTLLRISHQDINILIASDVEVARGIIAVLCRRLRRATTPRDNS